MTEMNKYCQPYEDWIRALRYKNTKDGTYQRLLEEYKDVESQKRLSGLKLTREQVAELEAHIPTCPRCTEALEQMNRLAICQSFRLQIWDLIFNPDEIAERKLVTALEKHSKDCIICEGEYEQVRTIREELKDIKLPKPPSDLQEKIKEHLKVKIEVTGSQRHPHRMVKFIRYATAASVLAVVFVLLLIFAPHRTLPEAVAEASKLHEMYLNGETNTLKEFATYDDLDKYCKGILSLPSGVVPKLVHKCSALCICGCNDVCDCVDCEASCFTNKGAWLVFPEKTKPTSLFVVKKVVKLPDWAKAGDYYDFSAGKETICACCKGEITYFWVSQLGKDQMHGIVVEAMESER